MWPMWRPSRLLAHSRVGDGCCPAASLLLVLLYCGLWNLAARLPLNRTDLDAFFVPATRIALSGHPFAVYSLRYQVVNIPTPMGRSA